MRTVAEWLDAARRHGSLGVRRFTGRRTSGARTLLFPWR